MDALAGGVKGQFLISGRCTDRNSTPGDEEMTRGRSRETILVGEGKIKILLRKYSLGRSPEKQKRNELKEEKSRVSFEERAQARQGSGRPNDRQYKTNEN